MDGWVGPLAVVWIPMNKQVGKYGIIDKPYFCGNNVQKIQIQILWHMVDSFKFSTSVTL